MWDKDAKQAHLAYSAGSAGRGHFFYQDDKIADYPQIDYGGNLSVWFSSIKTNYRCIKIKTNNCLYKHASGNYFTEK